MDCYVVCECFQQNCVVIIIYWRWQLHFELQVNLPLCWTRGWCTTKPDSSELTRFSETSFQQFSYQTISAAVATSRCKPAGEVVFAAVGIYSYSLELCRSHICSEETDSRLSISVRWLWYVKCWSSCLLVSWKEHLLASVGRSCHLEQNHWGGHYAAALT